MDSLEELETLDVPRGVVAAANRYAASRVSVVDIVREAKARPLAAKTIIEVGQELYKDHFDGFIAGAKWAAEKGKDGS